jgi:hypothetical protein
MDTMGTLAGKGSNHFKAKDGKKFQSILNIFILLIKEKINKILVLAINTDL